ncbi:MAG: hypothetical protein U5K38_05835 [Woeseiaceae bacterium]|nr:hypothetical protein [Woeseiaceae bacterium]
MAVAFRATARPSEASACFFTSDFLKGRHGIAGGGLANTGVRGGGSEPCALRTIGDKPQDVRLGGRQASAFSGLPIELTSNGGQPGQAIGQSTIEGLCNLVELHRKES